MPKVRMSQHIKKFNWMIFCCWWVLVLKLNSLQCHLKEKLSFSTCTGQQYSILLMSTSPKLPKMSNAIILAANESTYLALALENNNFWKMLLTSVLLNIAVSFPWYFFQDITEPRFPQSCPATADMVLVTK